ncbi:hypothetical protein BUALT_Bualt15G0075900 [Buddleja alternifolia]|uniref:Uncharacterized protein n=1 Tax=Buddleja alternifolia TaxID=168488 RepID=A0AAV6WBM1_9LAMI|nr:hypothetical protein BUALT_Bualt15G0075900 [Buddleja alternifolia]
MESRLTKPEFDAVLQLIQLSGGSVDDLQVLWVNFEAEKEEEEEESVGESSSLISTEMKCLDDEALPRRKPKFGSIIHIYRNTQPLINNRAQKKMDPELDAALQLIQLSGDSTESGGGGAKTAEHSGEESVGDSNEISSAVKTRSLEELRRRRTKRFRSIDDLYSVTRPITNKRGKKSIN